MLSATQGRSRSLGAACGAAHSAKIILESGDVRTLPIVDTILQLPMDLAPGYHRLYLDDHQTTLAVAPSHAFALDDATPGRRVWGRSEARPVGKEGVSTCRSRWLPDY